MSPKTGTRCPAWSDGPLGSKPLYASIGLPLARRASRPGVRSWSSPRQPSSASRPSGSGVPAAGPAGEPVTGGRREASERPDRGKACPSPSLCYRDRELCKPALRGVVAIGGTAADAGAARPPRSPSRSPCFCSGPSSCSASSVRPPRSPRTATTARASRIPRSCSRTSTSPKRRSSMTGPARSSWPASGRSSATSSPTTRSRPG